MARESKNRAVLFADVSESGVLYRTLGDVAARAVIGASVDTLAGVLRRHDGALVKTLGDAMLCVFPGADQAVRAAAEMQSGLRANPPQGQAIGMHMGVNYGPVLYEEADVFGDTVNVAAYLTAVAVRDQILITEATHAVLSPELRTTVRQMFSTLLKGSSRESLVYEVLWKADEATITQLNLRSSRTIPGDRGSLLLALNGNRVRIDQWKPSIRIGRGPESDLIVHDEYASRAHLTIRVRGTRFYVFDHSSNGTYVTSADGEETHVLHGEFLLQGSGQISLGRRRADSPREVITFEHDRRSMYRI